MLARERIEKEIQEETTLYNAGRKVERKYMDVGSIKRALTMRGSGASFMDIERDLKLQKGTVEKMGIGSIVGLPTGELLTDKDRDDGLMKNRRTVNVKEHDPFRLVYSCRKPECLSPARMPTIHP